MDYVAAKIRDLRMFEGDAGKPMDRSIVDIGGSVLVVSQFTLYGDVRKGRRPSFDEAARTGGGARCSTSDSCENCGRPA